MKKKRTLRTALLISFASLVALGAAGGGVFAWFALQNTASVNLSNIAVAGESVSASLKYCTLNYLEKQADHSRHFLGYKSNDSRIVENETYSYDAYFLNAGNAERTALKFAPGYSFTFAIEVNGTSNSQVILSKYVSEASSTYFYMDNEVRKGFALARALDVHSQVYDHKPSSSELYTYFSAQGVVGPDYFNFTESTTNAGTTVNQALSAGFNASSTAYFLLTMYFSDASSTWYSPAKQTTDYAAGTGNGSTTSFNLETGSLFVNSVTITDNLVANGDNLTLALSATPYQINSVKVNGVSKSQGTDYSLKGSSITFEENPGASTPVQVSYVVSPKEYSFTSEAVTFKKAPLNNATISVNHTKELDYYVADPTNGTSNVYEGLTIALTDLLIS